MHFVSGQFLLFVTVSLLGFHLVPSLRGRRLVLLASNLAFMGYLTGAPSRLVPIALFLASGFACVRVAQGRRRRDLTACLLVLVVSAFVYLKRYSVVAWLPALSAPYSVVGLSYVLFRVVHLMIDGHDGVIRAPVTPLAFFNYCCSFLSWLSGPIQRYEEYVEQERGLADVRLVPAQVCDALSRIVTGYFKIALVSAVLFDLHAFLAAMPLAAAGSIRFATVVGLGASAYTLYMYYNFSGYMDVVVGLGGLYGFHLPENFKKPFASESFLEFWSRWHITLSEWFKVYVFNPTTKALAVRWGTTRSMPYLGVAAYFVTFAVMGVWHGATPAFFVYGLLLGGGVSGNKLYEIEARRLLGKARFRRLRSNRVYRALCRGAVFAYFTAALVCFWVTPSRGHELGERWPLAVLTFGLLAVVATIVTSGGALATAIATPVSRRWRGLFEGSVGRPIGVGLKTYAVAMLLLVRTTAIPTFVYVPF